MKSAAEERKARTSMSSTFGSVMNPDADKDFKQSLESIMRKRESNARGRGLDDEDGQEIVSFFHYLI